MLQMIFVLFNIYWNDHVDIVLKQCPLDIAAILVADVAECKKYIHQKI